MLELRPYQREAIEALEKHFAERTDNPCIVLPTGSGKSYVIAEIIRRRVAIDPGFRCIVIAHRQELVEQNFSELKSLMGDSAGIDIGIFCAGLGRRDTGASVTFAGIDSVYNKACRFLPFDMIVVDEAHHIPVKDNGRYREFIRGCRELNSAVKIVGLTATPYRLGTGYVCHPSYVLNRVCYEANVGDLIKGGYLCNLRSKISCQVPDLKGVTIRNGDYKPEDLSNRFCVLDLVRNTVKDALARLKFEKRKCCVWFCVDVKHSNLVKDALAANMEDAAVVLGETPANERKEIVERFRRGEIRHLLNVAVFTEGFNVKQVDAIVLLRPTLSRGLYFQMVGRGLRTHQNKSDCIVLDYAQCILEHGPIDRKLDEIVPMEICSRCGEYFPRAIRTCSQCGYTVSETDLRRHEAADSKKCLVRKLHGEIAALDEILARNYGCGRYRHVLNKEADIKMAVLKFAFRTAQGDRNYIIKNNRSPIGNGDDEFKIFLEEFIRYAERVELTNLPDMVRNYFENDKWHLSELGRMLCAERAEERERRNEEIRAMFRQNLQGLMSRLFG